MNPFSINKRLGIVIALFLTIAPSASAQAGRTPKQAADDKLFLYFYQNPSPERLVGFLGRYGSHTNWNDFPPVIGFFAVVFREHPDWIERLIPPQIDPNSARAISAALRLSGNSTIKQKLHSRLTESDPKVKAEIANLPTRVVDIHVAGAAHVDILWGAFFASGDDQYVRMIIDFLAQIANRSELIALDVAKTILAMSGGPKEIYGQLNEKYGQPLGYQIIVAGTAGWSLRANARCHDRVTHAINAYISEHPGTHATKWLSGMQFRTGDPCP